MKRKTINYAGLKCYFKEEVSSAKVAQDILDSWKAGRIYAYALHEKGKHQIYVEKVMKYGIYNKDVKKEDRYTIEKLPIWWFDTKKEAREFIKKRVEDRIWSKEDTKNFKIMSANIGKIRQLLGW